MAEMTLQELAAETLVEKNRRLVQTNCKHEPDALFSSSVTTPVATYTNTVCLDCMKSWRTTTPKAGDRAGE